MPAGRGKRFSLLSLQPQIFTAPPKALSVCLHPFFLLRSEMDAADQPDSRQGHQYLNSGPVFQVLSASFPFASGSPPVKWG